MKSEEKVEEKKTSVESAPFERKEPKESDFTSPGELGTGYAEKSWEKPEEMTGKGPEKETELLERKETSEKEFTAPGELETGYTEKSWAKPEKSMEEKTTERAEEVRTETAEETMERKDMESGESGIGEKEAAETGEREDKEAKEREAREREDKEDRERETREKEAREEKRTIYSMGKRLTKSKTDRKLFGVCGGLGEYYGIDPTLVRLAFVLLGLLHGIGLILYIILAIIMPSEKNVEMVTNRK